MNKTVLVVDDEPHMREILRDYLENEGFIVHEADSGECALELLGKQAFHVALLDVMLPGIDGWTLCQHIRKSYSTPVILLTARSEEDDRLLGFELGADDYVTKPFSPKELIARVKSLLKRSEITQLAPAHIVSVEGISLNKFDRSVHIDHVASDFTPKEFDLLLHFMEHEGEILSRESIFKALWGHELGTENRTVDTHVKRLRIKLGRKAHYINTLVKSGYQFKVDL